jgi:hypothetical protein
MMKPLKSFLNVLFAAASIFSFLVGWILFSRSGKPAPLIAPQNLPDPQVSVTTDSSNNMAAAALPTLEPLPTLSAYANTGTTVQSQNNINLQPLQVLPSTSNTNNFQPQPRLRTRGS